MFNLNAMKTTSIILSFVFFMSFCTALQAQEDKSKRPSPPVELKGTIDSADIAVFYSSPAVKGRLIWGELVPYGKVWRTGANEATIFETNKALMIQDQVLAPGKYALFTIPGEIEWTFIFNSEWNQWGAFKYDKTNDVLRINVPVEKSSTFNERMKFDIIDNNVVLFWEKLQVGFPVIRQ
jgi:hypothetical protein